MHQYTHWKQHKMRERQMRARWHPNKLTHTHSEEHTASKHQQNTQIVFQTTTNNYNTNHKFTTKSRTSQSDIYKNIYIFIINVHISVITKKNHHIYVDAIAVTPSEPSGKFVSSFRLYKHVHPLHSILPSLCI